jgi:hypothetical protein
MDELEELARKNSAARKIIDIIVLYNSGSFTENAVLVEELMSPGMDEMHKIEADEPVLSSMLPLIRGLMQHISDFANEYPHLAMPMPRNVWAESSDSDTDAPHWNLQQFLRSA